MIWMQSAVRSHGFSSCLVPTLVTEYIDTRFPALSEAGKTFISARAESAGRKSAARRAHRQTDRENTRLIRANYKSDEIRKMLWKKRSTNRAQHPLSCNNLRRCTPFELMFTRIRRHVNRENMEILVERRGRELARYIELRNER